MGQLIRSKRKWVCSACSAEQIVWEGQCRSCKATSTLEEITIIPQTKSKETDVARKLRRRAKDSERNIAKRMTEIDGVDPAYKNIASTTGRVGHITGFRIDAVSRNYVTENKNRKMPTWLIHAWILINQRGHDFNKNVLLHVEPPNMPREFVVNGTKQKLDTMAIITQSRHEELIMAEKTLEALMNTINADSRYDSLYDLYSTLQGRNKT